MAWSPGHKEENDAPGSAWKMRWPGREGVGRIPRLRGQSLGSQQALPVEQPCERQHAETASGPPQESAPRTGSSAGAIRSETGVHIICCSLDCGDKAGATSSVNYALIVFIPLFLFLFARVSK